MSDYVRYTGTLTEVDRFGLTNLEFAEKTLKERDKEIDPIYIDTLECLVDQYPEEFFLYNKTQTLYKVEKEEIDPYHNISDAIKNPNDSISFHLKYYKDRCGFDEALDEALSKIETK